MKFSSYFSRFTFIVMAISSLFCARQVQAAALSESKGQSAIELENVQASVRFGEEITFLATIKSSIPIQTVSILISDESNGVTQQEPVAVPADGQTEFRLDTKQNNLRPFTNVKWLYEFTFPDGSSAQSEPFFIRYTDNRFDWQTLEAGMLRVNWYAGDANFGPSALDAAQAGLLSIGKLIPADGAPQPVEIFIYANAEDLRGTLNAGSNDWVAGHADPALGVAMLVIEPGAEQGLRMEQRIPHELMHVMLYRRVGTGYQNIPAWLREGLATVVETYPNADYDRVLSEAVAGNRLIPLNDLCASFPADVGQAFLAYAESRSFTNYLHETYGSNGLLTLAASYADGVACEHGTERVFGIPLSNLDAQWRSSVLGQNTFLPALQNISPYLVLLCLVLVIPLVGIVSTLRKKGNQYEPETSVRK